MLAGIFFILFPFMAVIPFILIGMYYGYIYTIKLVYEYGYNKNVNKEKREYSNIEYYEEETALSLLMIFPYIFIVLCIAALFCEVFGVHIKVTLPIIAMADKPGLWTTSQSNNSGGIDFNAGLTALNAFSIPWAIVFIQLIVFSPLFYLKYL